LVLTHTVSLTIEAIYVGDELRLGKGYDKDVTQDVSLMKLSLVLFLQVGLYPFFKSIRFNIYPH